MVIRKLAIYSFAGIILSLNLALNANTLKKNNFIGTRYSFAKNKNFNDKKINHKETFLTDNKNQYNNIDIYNSYPVANPNLLNIKGPKISIVLNKTPAKKAFEYLAKLGNYGYVWVKNDPTNKDQQGSGKADDQRLITLNMKNVNFRRAFNAVIIASGLQAKIYNNVIYVGPNVRNTVFTYRDTSIIQLNQITASSAADYLANLGASVTKTFTVSTSVTEGASQSQSIQGGASSSTTTSQSETTVKTYGADIGPLVGLIATTDERLQTITLVGEKNIVRLAKSYLKNLDKRQKQVALNVKVLDVNLSDKDSFSQSWFLPFNSGSPYIITQSPNFKAGIGTPRTGDFTSELTASIQKGSTKVLASPTLILNESGGAAGDGSSTGRSLANEGFVEVGDQVPVNATFVEGSGCNFTYDLVGIKLGAKVLGIDRNRFVTFAMTPIVTGISGTQTITNCGEVNLLNTRRLDTGAVRIKNGETLVLTGVIQDSDIETLIKFPILGDIPIMGSLFRSTSKEIGKRELIVLVTPKIIDDTGNNLKNYDFKLKNKESIDLINSIED
jgi:type IV pilus assembly protein PilQ